jgi:hypothetical protein
LAFSTVLAGGGCKRGHIIGKSDASGDRLESEQHEPKHLNATIAHALGMDLNRVVNSPSGRPFTVATHKMDGTKPVTAVEPIMDVFA